MCTFPIDQGEKKESIESPAAGDDGAMRPRFQEAFSCPCRIATKAAVLFGHRRDHANTFCDGEEIFHQGVDDRRRRDSGRERVPVGLRGLHPRCHRHRRCRRVSAPRVAHRSGGRGGGFLRLRGEDRCGRERSAAFGRKLFDLWTH